jgi:hypothetical protein
VRQLIKRLLYAIAPRSTTALMSARARAHSHRVVASWGCGLINRKLVERFGPRVQEGPFAGLTLTPMTYAEQVGPCLLGVYESELDEAWAIVSRGSYTQVIDIGAKFGYYAVGLARKYPAASVVAFDTDWWARKAVREMAAANETSNVEVKGFCGAEWVDRHLQEAVLVISDCEGYEAALFGPDIIPKLRSATLIIETHDMIVPGVSDRLRSAFGTTHLVREYGMGALRRAPTHSLDFLSAPERHLAVQEVRPDQIWLFCIPKAGPNQALQQMAGASAASRPSSLAGAEAAG